MQRSRPRVSKFRRSFTDAYPPMPGVAPRVLPKRVRSMDAYKRGFFAGVATMGFITRTKAQEGK